MSITVIPSKFKGIKFRSRTEARWAVFMDNLGVRYEYEPEGFTDGNICYLPDFWLPGLDCYLEVKPTAPTKDEYQKAAMVVAKTKRPIIFMVGAPHMPDRRELTDRYPEINFIFSLGDNKVGAFSRMYWASCEHCGKIGFGEFDCYGLMLCHRTLCEWAEQGKCSAIRRAVLASLNFQFGAAS